MSVGTFPVHRELLRTEVALCNRYDCTHSNASPVNHLEQIAHDDLLALQHGGVLSCKLVVVHCEHPVSLTEEKKREALENIAKLSVKQLSARNAVYHAGRKHECTDNIKA
jgi:hypothetical protein